MKLATICRIAIIKAIIAIKIVMNTAFELAL